MGAEETAEAATWTGEVVVAAPGLVIVTPAEEEAKNSPKSLAVCAAPGQVEIPRARQVVLSTLS